MKNFLIALFFIATVSCVLQIFLPWWIIAVVGFAAGYFFRQKSFMAFLAGFFAVFILWVVYAYLLSSANGNILASKVALLLPLKGNINGLLLVTGLVGGLISGFGALSGSLAAKLKV